MRASTGGTQRAGDRRRRCAGAGGGGGKAGYGAEMIQDETERRERQQQTARANMKRFSWQAALGLALGIPLMARGLFGGSMTLTPETQRPAAGRRHHRR